MNKVENLLASVSEECGEASQVACKAMRFGLDHLWPEKNETNRRILEREIADILGAAEELGLTIRREDVEAKRVKIRKYQSLSVELGTLDGEEWKPGDAALSPGGQAVEVIRVLANDWVLTRYVEGGDEIRWKRWELLRKAST